MSRVLSDLSQLTKAMVKPPEAPPKPTSKVVEREDVRQSQEDADAAAVLAYFSRPSQNAPQRNHVAPCAVPAKDRTVAPEAALKYPPTAKQSPVGRATGGAKDAALAALAEEKATADARIAELERLLATEREAHEAAIREHDRLQGECGRLQGELRRRGENAPVSPLVATPAGRPAAGGYSPVEVAPVAKDEHPKPTQGILAAPGAVAEVFPGEVHEHVVATLLDGLGSAERSGRERRAEILRCVLAANESAGELERRRVELRQILKDAGYYNDPKPLERLGLRLISGRNHWKLQYANVRVTLAKTPSDYRANLNSGSEIANRCF